MTDRDAVVVEAVRTAIGIGKPEKGDLNRVHPVNVGSQLIRGLVARTGIAPTLIDEVIWGCVSQVDEQSFNIARNTALAAGLPEAVTGTTVDRQCGSSMQSLQFAAASVLAGHYDVVVAGGVEIMSRVPMFSNAAGADPYGPVNDRYAGRLVPQGISAEMVAERWDLSRAYLDEIALESHARAAKAQANGLFDEEIVPIDTGAGVVTHDQGIRTNTSLERMAVLRPAFKDDGVITAGGSTPYDLAEGSGTRAHPARSVARLCQLRCRPSAHADGAHPGYFEGPKQGRNLGQRCRSLRGQRSVRVCPRGVVRGNWDI
jgi:acetyl-CoA acyltransferase